MGKNNMTEEDMQWILENPLPESPGLFSKSAVWFRHSAYEIMEQRRELEKKNRPALLLTILPHLGRIKMDLLKYFGVQNGKKPSELMPLAFLNWYWLTGSGCLPLDKLRIEFMRYTFFHLRFSK